MAYADRLSELSSSQWDAVKASESAKDAILELNETRVENEITGIEKEIDAYNELTQAQIDALKASKDLHDYEQSIVEKTKSVTDLERQIAAMLNDDSAATVAKRKKLEEQLAEARKDLEETEYDHSIEAQENALNKQSEDYENARNNEINALRESLNDKEAILAASFETVRANSSLIGQEIATLAAEHGITVSNSLISSWQSGENAIASYGTALSKISPHIYLTKSQPCRRVFLVQRNPLLHDCFIPAGNTRRVGPHHFRQEICIHRRNCNDMHPPKNPSTIHGLKSRQYN